MRRIPSISVTSRKTLDVPPIPGTRTGSYSFHSEKFRKSCGIFRNRYETLDQPKPFLRATKRLMGAVPVKTQPSVLMRAALVKRRSVLMGAVLAKKTLDQSLPPPSRGRG